MIAGIACKTKKMYVMIGQLPKGFQAQTSHCSLHMRVGNLRTMNIKDQIRQKNLGMGQNPPGQTILP